MKTPALPIVLALLLAAPAPVLAQADAPRDRELTDGIQQLKSGDFETAVITLDRVVRRLAARPESRRDLVEARVQLGVAYVGLGQSEAARTQFREAVVLDPALRLSPEDFSPKVLAAFEAARGQVAPAATPTPPVRTASASPAPTPAPAATRPGASTPAPKKKGSKTPLLIAGVAGVGAAVAVAAAAGGKGPAPAPTPVPACSGGQVGLTNARWEITSFACPDGVTDFTYAQNVLVDVAARGCALSVTDAQVVVTVVTAFRTFNTPGQQFVANGLGVSPTSVSNGSATVRVLHNLTCSNNPGPSDAFNEYQATLTLNTSAGALTANTSTPFRITFP